MINNISLKDKCEVVTQKDGYRFVGVKVSTTDVKIFFPLGYQLPKSDDEVRKDIFNLLDIINKFRAKEDYFVPNNTLKSSNNIYFPLNSFIEVLKYYMENGYYMENEFKYSTRNRGKINWSKTIKNQKPLFQEDSEETSYPFYLSFTVRESDVNLNNEVTNIHKYCVYESFEKIGWLFTSYVPPKPNVIFNEMKFLTILRKELCSQLFRVHLIQFCQGILKKVNCNIL